MSKIQLGDRLRVKEVHKFDVPVCKEFFPNGLTKDHRLIAMDDESYDRVTVMVAGIFENTVTPELVWIDPVFRLPSDKVAVVNA